MKKFNISVYASALLLLSAALTSSFALATERMYATVSALYTDSDNDGQKASGLGYKLGVGHQFHPQWYVEAGIQQLLDQRDPFNQLQADALYLSFLGKARNRHGELFYRLGFMRLDLAGLLVPEETVCAAVVPSPCAFSHTRAAANIGLGFDFFITNQWLLRLEGEYIQAERDFSAGVFSLGLRYNFN